MIKHMVSGDAYLSILQGLGEDWEGAGVYHDDGVHALSYWLNMYGAW